MSERSRSIPSDSFLELVSNLDVGSPIAEDDSLLHEARVETSFARELLHDSVDIIKGTKGSGKTALFRIFTDFLAEWMLDNQQVVKTPFSVPGVMRVLVPGEDSIRPPIDEGQTPVGHRAQRCPYYACDMHARSQTPP